MTFIDSIRRQLQDMSATERQRAISSLRDLIYEDAYTHALHPATDDGVACPRCGSLDVVRKGHDHDGTQRWLCKDCHRTFRNAADTIITRSKLRPAVWMRYLECFVDRLPLRECASRCHISLRTSWLMRMRLIESIRRHLPRFHAAAGCAVQLDERTRGDRPQFASRPFQCAGPVGDDGAQREEPRMPVRPVEQAEPVGEPHAGQVRAIIDGPVEPAMVGEQESGAEQADAGRIQENIPRQGVQRVRETFRRVLARRRLRRDDEDPVRGLRGEAGASFDYVEGLRFRCEFTRIPFAAVHDVSRTSDQVGDQTIRFEIPVVDSFPACTDMIHGLRVVAGQTADAGRGIVDRIRQFAARRSQSDTSLHVLFAREIMTVHSGSPP